jgi:hypothetical protein
VDELFVVHVFDCLECLIEELEGFYLVELLMLVEMVKEISIFCVFNNNIK